MLYELCISENCSFFQTLTAQKKTTDRAAGNVRPLPQRAQREAVLVQLRAHQVPHGARSLPQQGGQEAARPQRLPPPRPVARVLGGRPPQEEEDRGPDRREENGRRRGGK